MTIANLTRDVSGAPMYGLPFSANSYSATLTANADTTLVVPSITPMGNINQNGTQKQNIAAVFTFDPGTTVWVANNVAAAAPAGATFASTASEMNPAVRYVQYGDTLHFLSTEVSTNVSVAFYSLD